MHLTAKFVALCLILLSCGSAKAEPNSQTPDNGSALDADIGLLQAQSIELVTAPEAGQVSLLQDGSGILVVGSHDATTSFALATTDDYGTSIFQIDVVGTTSSASVSAIQLGGPEIMGAKLSRNNDLMVMIVYINRPAVAASNAMDIDYPAPDGTGRCHDPDFPEFVPEDWPIGVVQDALDAIEESIRNRNKEITDPNANPDLEPGHRERLRREHEWARKLRNRLAQLSRVTLGATLVAVGAEMIVVGGATTGILVADDVTVIGVADDPLIVVTGGVFVVGGITVIAGELLDWWDF